MTLRVGWFTAGRGPGSRGMFAHVLSAIERGTLDAHIEFVFMHRERGEGEGSDAFMDLALAHGVPLVQLSSRRFARERGAKLDAVRDAYDAQVLDLLAAGPRWPDVCVLAGYLLICSPALVRWRPFVNLHPALPGGPVGLWQDVIWQLIESRAAETGAHTFLVTEDLDRGPVIAYARVPLRGHGFDALWRSLGTQDVASARIASGEEHPLFQAIRAAEVQREPPLVAETLRMIASGALRLADGAVLDASGKPAAARDLTTLVDAALTARQ